MCSRATSSKKKPDQYPGRVLLCEIFYAYEYIIDLFCNFGYDCYKLNFYLFNKLYAV